MINTHTDPTLNQLLDAYQRAKADVIAALDYPCTGQVYTYTRGSRTYVKWQTCSRGRRVQRTFALAALEVLTAGVQAHHRLQEKLEQYYTASQNYRLYALQHGTAESPVQKTPARHGRRSIS